MRTTAPEPMAYEPTQRRDVPGPQPLRLNQPETGAAQRPWFRDDPAAPIGAPQPAALRARPAGARPVDVQPLPQEALGAPRQSNWLLELEGDTPVEAPPEVESSEPVVPETSYVEPETPRTLVSRALAPAGLALVLSFLAVGGFAFWKSGGMASAPIAADPLDADPAIVSGQRSAQLVAPPNSGGSGAPTRVGTLRAGVAQSAPTSVPKPTQRTPSPTAPVASPVTTPVTTPLSTPTATGATSASIEPGVELRSAVTTPVLESERTIGAAALEGSRSGAPTAASNAPSGVGAVAQGAALDGAMADVEKDPSIEGAPTEQGSSATKLDELLRSHASAGSAQARDTGLDAALVGGVAETRPPLDPSSAADSEMGQTDELIDQFFGALLGAGPAAPTASTEVARDVEHATEVEVLGHVALDAADPAPVFTGAEPTVAITTSEPTAEDVATGVRLDLGWDELTELTGDPASASELAAGTTDPALDLSLTLATSTLATPTLDTPALDTPALDTPALDTPALDTPILDAPTEVAVSTPDAPPLVGPTLDWTMLDWTSPTEPAPSPSALTGATLAGPAPDGSTTVDSPAVALAPSVAIERSPSSDWPLPAEPIGPAAPTTLTSEGSGGTDGVDFDSTALASELDGLLATLGPRTRPADAPNELTPPIAIATETPRTTPTAPETSVVGATPSDVPVEVMPPVATPSTETGHRSVLRRADEAGMWTALDVPNSVVVGPELLMTPYTGNVRVVFGGGDSFEGRLHAVGQSTITLDTKLGRMTLDARRLERIERLATEGPSPKSPAKVANDTSGLEEVRVLTRGGGTFVGHLVSRDGNQVTLIVVEGYRMTVEATEVTPTLGGRATSSLRRAGEKGAAPVKPTNPAPPTQR